MPARSTTVGEARAWLEAAYGIPHTLSTHYVIVTGSPAGLGIIGCCDGTDEAGILLAVALRALTGEARPVPESGSVIVSTDDLRTVLADFIGGKDPGGAFSRLAAIAGVG